MITVFERLQRVSSSALIIIIFYKITVWPYDTYLTEYTNITVIPPDYENANNQ